MSGRKTRGQLSDCSDGSGDSGICDTGIAAATGCAAGSGGIVD
jgi:hypothetical protein